jgi:hypothetical protein
VWNGWWEERDREREREIDTKRGKIDSKREGDRFKTPHFPGRGR